MPVVLISNDQDLRRGARKLDVKAAFKLELATFPPLPGSTNSVKILAIPTTATSQSWTDVIRHGVTLVGGSSERIEARMLLFGA
jgi:hypothetical protein